MINFMRNLLRSGIGVATIGLLLTFNKPVSANIACPTGTTAIPVVGWLISHIDSVTVHHYDPGNGGAEMDGYPKVSTDPTLINYLLNLKGSFIKFNGYAAPSSFGTFYYPRWGGWYAEYELHTGPIVHFVWMWRSYRYNLGRLLVFTFRDMEQGTDSQGQHSGQHNFCMTSVPLWSINRLEQFLR